MKLYKSEISLSKFITVFVVSIVVIFGSILSFAILTHVDNSVKHSQEHNLSYDVNTIKKELLNYLNTYRIILENHANNPIVIQATMQPESNMGNIKDYLSNIKILQKEYKVTLVDFQGEVIYGNTNLTMKQDLL